MMKKRLTSLILVLVLLVSAGSISFAERDYSKIDMFLDYIENYYYEEVSEEEIMDAVYNAMFRTLDKNSSYFTQQQFKVFSEDSQGSFGGIGVTITVKDGYIHIIQMYSDSPAKEAGLEVDDYIVKVDGESIVNIPLDVAASKIRGEIDSDVTLTILRNGTEFDVVVTRKLITIKNVEFEILEGNIGYLKIARFADNTNTVVHDALRLFIQEQVKGIIVDLRDNPGGLVNSVVSISELFLPKEAPILYIDYKAFKDETFVSNINGIEHPMVVLVNKSSASASEIFASAMQDNNRAIIVGETTYGKGTVQSLIPMTDSSGFKLTIAEYLSANMNKIDQVGVVPDIIINGDKIDDSNFAPMNQKRDIYLGEVSLNVYGAQQRLVALGYDIDVDGIFGPQTLSAITDFQKTNDLYKSGRLDLKTVEYFVLSINERNQEDMVLKKALNLLK